MPTLFMHVYLLKIFFWTSNLCLEVDFFLASKMLDVQTSFFGRPIFLDVQKNDVHNFCWASIFWMSIFFCWSSKLFFGVRFWERPTFFWDVQINFWDVRKKVWNSKKFGCPFFGRPIFWGGDVQTFLGRPKKKWTSKT